MAKDNGKSGLSRIFTLEIARVTEAAAVAAAGTRGRGDEVAADQAAVDAMRRELNRLPVETRQADALPAGPRLTSPRRVEVKEGDPLESVLRDMLASGASDMLLVPGAPITLRVNGKLTPLDGEPLEEDTLRAWLLSHLGDYVRLQLETADIANQPLFGLAQNI